MQLTKVKKSFSDYDVTLSWGQLEAIRAALEANHADPVSDEMLAELDWYMDRVPGPGEEEEEVKQREEGGMPAEGEEQAGDGDYPIEMPPTEGPADTGSGPMAPPAEMPGSEEAGLPPEGGTPGGPKGAQPPEGKETPPLKEEPAPSREGPPEDADEHLAAPPAE